MACAAWCACAPSADFRRVEALWLDDTRYAVRHASRDKEEWLVTLEGVGDRDAADALRGRTVRLQRADVPVADDELLVADLVGCTVVDVAGATHRRGDRQLRLRRARGARAARRRRGKEILLPLVDAFLVSIDLQERRIVYDPPEGLLDARGRRNDLRGRHALPRDVRLGALGEPPRQGGGARARSPCTSPTRAASPPTSTTPSTTRPTAAAPAWSCAPIRSSPPSKPSRRRAARRTRSS